MRYTNGVVERVVYPVIPPHVEYFLTDAGRSLQEVFLAMCRWGTAFLKHEYDFPQQHA